MSQRIQLRRTRGWRMPEGAVVVSRPSKWGNPFPVAEYGLDEALRRYAASIAGREDEIRADLAGKDLACWCPLDQPCHADVLLRVAMGGQP